MEEFNFELEKISYRYNESKNFALEDISIKISNKDKLVILGRNGVGKSTLFYIANGLYKPTSGNIKINGKLIKTNKEIISLREKVGLVFQDPDTQFVAPTVYEEISFGLMNKSIEKNIARELVDSILNQLEITHLKNKSLYTLSGGEKKIVSIASILVMKPKIIFFDEPTAGLDYKTSQMFLQILEKLYSEGIGLVISTHDIDFAWEWSNRVIIIKDGRLIGDDKSSILLRDKNLMEKAALRRPYFVEFSEKYLDNQIR